MNIKTTNDLFEDLKKIINIPDGDVVELNLNLKINSIPILTLVTYATNNNDGGSFPELESYQYEITKIK